MITLNALIVIAVFAVAGYFIGKRIPRPQKMWVWVAWLVGLVIAGYIGVNAAIVRFPGFTIDINNVLQGLLLGIIICFAIERK